MKLLDRHKILQRATQTLSFRHATISFQSEGETSAGPVATHSFKHSSGSWPVSVAIAAAVVAGERLIPALHATRVGMFC